MPLSSCYVSLNRAIAEYCFSEASSSNEAYLTITPRILATLISRSCGKSLTPDESEKYLVRVVSEVYQSSVIRDGLRYTFRITSGQDKWPKCIAFLALTVLAAYQMHADEAVGANAYYKRLADLLECKVDGIYPQGFNPSEFEDLWVFLRDELEQGDLRGRRRIQLASPELGSDNKRYISYPLTHVPLRKIDVEKLPEFFTMSGYEPESRISNAKIDFDLNHWSRLQSLSKPGKEALNDRRRKAAIAEIAQELELWDGSVTKPTGEWSAPIELLLDTSNKQQKLFYFPRRPSKFPESLIAEEHHFLSGQDGWYSLEPVLREDGHKLLNGISWKTIAKGIQIVLERSGATAISFVPSQNNSYSGSLSNRKLIRGMECSALVHESIADSAKEYIQAISNSRCETKSYRGLPDGWCLFHKFKVERYLESPLPAELSALNVESEIDIKAIGGLRLGGRNAWLLGAPPRLVVTGNERKNIPIIDGHVASINDSGLLIDEDSSLSRPGIHIIEIEALTKRIEIIDPEAGDKLSNWPIPNTNLCNQIALPKGAWKLVGELPGQVLGVESDSWNGFITNCQFRAIWAIKASKHLEMLQGNLSVVDSDDIVPGFKNLKMKDFVPKNYTQSHSILEAVAARLECEVSSISQLDNEEFRTLIWNTRKLVYAPTEVIGLIADPPKPKKINRSGLNEQKNVDEWISLIYNTGLSTIQIASLFPEINLGKLKAAWQMYESTASIAKLSREMKNR
jgi:hypothetical protein